MAVLRCAEGHIFDGATNPSCPVCGWKNTAPPAATIVPPPPLPPLPKPVAGAGAPPPGAPAVSAAPVPPAQPPSAPPLPPAAAVSAVAVTPDLAPPVAVPPPAATASPPPTATSPSPVVATASIETPAVAVAASHPAPAADEVIPPSLPATDEVRPAPDQAEIFTKADAAAQLPTPAESVAPVVDENPVSTDAASVASTTDDMAKLVDELAPQVERPASFDVPVSTVPSSSPITARPISATPLSAKTASRLAPLIWAASGAAAALVLVFAGFAFLPNRGVSSLLDSGIVARLKSSIASMVEKPAPPKPVPAPVEQVAVAAPSPPPPPPPPPVNYAGELTDYNVAPIEGLQRILPGPTPLTVPRARRLATNEVKEAQEKGALLIEAMDRRAGPGIPGAVRLPFAGQYSRLDGRGQRRVAEALAALTGNDLERPLVFLCQNAQCWESYNAVVRATTIGYRNVYWYRGGLAAWQAANLPVRGEAAKQ